MFVINILEYLFAFEFTQWLFGAFAFFGVMLCIQKLIFKRGVV